MNRLVPIICPFCGAGCGMYLQCESEFSTSVVPSRSNAISQGQLCVRGWQIGDMLRNAARLTSPLIAGEPASWSEGMAKAAELLGGTEGSRIGIVAAGHLSNEEGFAANYFARQVVGTAHVDNFGRAVDGPSLWGLQYSPGELYARPGLDEMVNYDLLVCLNSSLRQLNAQAGSWVKKAQQAGTRLILFDELDDGLAGGAEVYVQHVPGATAALLQQLLKLTAGEVESAAALDLSNLGADSLAQQLDSVAELIQSAGRIGIVFSMRAFATPEPGMLAAELAKQINASGSQQADIFAVAGAANSVGVEQMGLTPEPAAGAEALGLFEILDPDQAEVDAIVVIGEELTGWIGESGVRALAQGSKPLIVLDSFCTPTAEIADVALPMAVHAEKEGSFTWLDGTVRWSGQAVAALEGVRYLPQILAELAVQLGKGPGPSEVDAIWEQIKAEVAGYEEIDLAVLRQSGPQRLGARSLSQQTGVVERDYQAPAQEASDQWPYKIVSRYDRNWWIHDWRMRAIPVLFREMRDWLVGYVLMNPGDLAKEEIRPGRSGEVTTPYGSGEVAIYPHPGLPAGLILLPAHQNDLADQLLGPGRYNRQTGGRVHLVTPANVQQ